MNLNLKKKGIKQKKELQGESTIELNELVQ